MTDKRAERKGKTLMEIFAAEEVKARRNTKHSPGPWKQEQLVSSLQIHDAKGMYVAEVAYDEDAHLIAASPDLLDKGKALEAEVAIGGLGDRKTSKDVTRYGVVLREFREAIAKAEGSE